MTGNRSLASVRKQKSNFEDNFYSYAHLYLNSKTDAIPVRSVNVIGRDKVNFQIPGSSGFSVDVVTAMKWAQAILEICQSAIVYKEEAEAKE